MLTNLRQAMSLIGRRQRARWGMLIVLALVVSGFEMIGGALVYVLLGLVADPSGEIGLPFIGDLRRLTGDPADRTLLLTIITGMAVFFPLRAVVRVANVYIQRRIAENAGAMLSKKLVYGYLAWPYQLHLHRHSSEFIRNGHQAVQELVRQVFIPAIQVSAEALVAIALLALIVVIAPAATGLAVLVVGGAAGLLLLFVQASFKRIGRTAHAMQRETLETLQQSLHGIRDIKVLGCEEYFARRYGRSRLSLARANYLRATLKELPAATIELAVVGFILTFFAVTVMGGQDALAALPILGLFAYAGTRLQPPLQRIVGGLNDLKYSAAPLADLHADLQTVDLLPPREPAVDPLSFQEAIALEKVALRYHGTDHETLTDIDLTIRPGEQIGICGPTGGGKTTLVDLITGLLEPTAGRITIDGHDLANHVRAWQRNLGVVPQMVFLIDDSLRRNVALGVPDESIDEQALAEAIDLAQLTEFVASQPAGLDTKVGERGVRISGGQRQRIAIARALYRRPAVLIFDEGTSALDNATESQLMAAIEHLRGKHTVILIAHRLSTVRNSDRVVFIEQGRIAGEGPFDSLYGENERFRALARTP